MACLTNQVVSDREVYNFLEKCKMFEIEYVPACTQTRKMTVGGLRLLGIHGMTAKAMCIDEPWEFEENMLNHSDDTYPKYKIVTEDATRIFDDFEKLVEFVRIAIILKRNTAVSHG